MIYDAVGGLHRQRDGARDGVIHVDEVYRKRARLNAVLGLYGAQMHVIQAVLAQLVVHQRERKTGAVNGRIGLDLLH